MTNLQSSPSSAPPPSSRHGLLEMARPKHLPLMRTASHTSVNGSRSATSLNDSGVGVSERVMSAEGDQVFALTLCRSSVQSAKGGAFEPLQTPDQQRARRELGGLVEPFSPRHIREVLGWKSSRIGRWLRFFLSRQPARLELTASGYVWLDKPSGQTKEGTK